MSSTLPVSRRTVARGAAWSVPLVAVSVAAPAFATSANVRPTISASSCKCPGGNAPYIYNLFLTWTVPSTGWSANVTQVTFTDQSGTSTMTIQSPTGAQPISNGTTIQYVLASASNSKSTYTTAISYTATKSGSPSFSDTVTVNNFMYNPCDKGICP